MKKVFIIICAMFILFSCSDSENLKKIDELENKVSQLENDKDLERNTLCWEKRLKYIDKYTKEFGNRRTFRDSWFSPILNTCILESAYYSLEPLMEWDNYNWKYLTDILKGEDIWSVEYFEESGFEWWSKLPKECNINFNKIEEIAGIEELLLPLVTNSEVGQEIYNTEFNYINCINYLKWNKNKIQLLINDIDFKYDYEAFDHIRY